jgi:hypothetical protein
MMNFSVLVLPGPELQHGIGSQTTVMCAMSSQFLQRPRCAGLADRTIGDSAVRQGLRIGCAVRNDEGAGHLVKEAIVRHCHE